MKYVSAGLLVLIGFYITTALNTSFIQAAALAVSHAFAIALLLGLK